MRSVAISFVVALGLADPPGLEKVGRLDHGPIREASGIVASRRHPGIFWVHNDSGNPPVLYAVRRDGSLVREFAVAAPNVDWEDVAIDDDGHLYLGDVGNNGGRLPIRAIYRLDEPDPEATARAPLKPTLASYYRFRERGRFDAEGLFLDGGRAVLVAKYLDGREAELFAVPLDPPAPLLRPALPEKVGTLPGFTEPATGADLSPAGRLAVCSPAVTRIYKRDGDAWERLGEVRYPPEQIEAIAWDGDDLILASESRALYRINEATWRSRPHAKASATPRAPVGHAIACPTGLIGQSRPRDTGRDAKRPRQMPQSPSPAITTDRLSRAATGAGTPPPKSRANWSSSVRSTWPAIHSPAPKDAIPRSVGVPMARRKARNAGA